MEAVHFDSTGKQFPAHEARSGIVGFISWQRLASVLRAGGELRNNEAVLSFQVDDRGLSFRVKTDDHGGERR